MRTPLDQAHAQMQDAPEDAALRLRYYERLAQCELFLLLEREAANDSIAPVIFPFEGDSYGLAFDSEARLTDFTGRAAPFVAMSGRQLAEMLAGQGLGLGVNLDVAPSSHLLPPAALTWMREVLQNTPTQARDRPVELTAPLGVDEGVLRALDAKFAAGTGLADHALLAGVRYEDGRQGLLLAVISPRAGAERALRQAVAETVSFSAAEMALDVTFLAADEALSQRMARVGLRFDFPKPEIARPLPAAPGMDPDNPPKLR